MNRTGQVARKTGETEIFVTIDLDGEGASKIETGIGFFDHMLSALAKHGLFDLTVQVKGDLEVDGHHTVEDTGIVLGTAIAQALADKKGIRRVGSCFMPMDESLAFCALDISGRPYLAFSAEFPAEMCGGYASELTEEFFRAVSVASGITLHLKAEGRNTHHMIEALYKAFARALRDAAALDPRVKGVPSTKGVL
ncbi:MAG: imidazoleglycerol-phosphate dehydratase HisB [Candidatus Spyradocola sp.]